jgi:hypothetical protein
MFIPQEKTTFNHGARALFSQREVNSKFEVPKNKQIPIRKFKISTRKPEAMPKSKFQKQTNNHLQITQTGFGLDRLRVGQLEFVCFLEL